MTVAWTVGDLRLLDAARELEIAVRRGDGTLGASLPIWVVCAKGEVYVRSWHRRDTGWFGAAIRTRRASVRIPGLVDEVVIVDVGNDIELVAAVDAAYRSKYGEAGAASMVTTDAAATTLRLVRE